MTGYATKSRQVLGHYALATIDSLAATGDNTIWNVGEPITVVRIEAIIGTVTSDTGAAVVKFDKRVLTNSDTGRGDGDVGTLTVPVSTAAGKILYKNVRVDCSPGDQIVAEVTTTSAAGSAYYEVHYIRRHEEPANLTDMIASA